MSGHSLVSSLGIQAGEQPSDRVAALFDRHHQRLYRLARRLTPAADDALDLVQETFLRAARATSAVPRGCEREEAWLVRVLINIRRDQWRREAAQRRHDERTRSDARHEAPDHGSAVVAHATIWRALDMLPPRRRAILVMHELEGLAVSTIASQLGITTITVRWHLSAARRDLARVLVSTNGDVQ